MTKNTYKVIVDLFSMLALLAAIITGFMLHQEVWHLHIYDNKLLWGTHETIGLMLIALLATHCVQHYLWFKNYAKLHGSRKIVTSLLLLAGIITAISGIVLMCGSSSEFISHAHYAGAMLFTAIAIGHTVKRWKMLKAIS